MNFPKIKESEYAILIADSNTGIILDVDFNIYIDDNQAIYRIFSSIDEVKEFIEEILKEKENIEIIVYDNNKNVVMFQK
ncbi:hypothetical protein [Bergeyella cardium]|jgi:hypothetical protein|uniref:Uncharacterized protein n=1 Tax=Bergeyella cardium TaxID=1585976 RepID=A0A6P1QTJ8_9FLAO|nr:hypothetical protein [Bergeyella cardium]QHN65426.1 hypothetical protein DBX24_05775 [Bergeyella cardium]WHE33005.1 hypothetical protein P8603_05805 [Bergeyella cardium]WHF59656.1 hypothetical protein O0R51_05800 [Bergeyella cardium]